jgi:hypothetical protein
MKKILLLLLFTTHALAGGGNGSGSTGNGITLDDKIATLMPEDSVELKGKRILDSRTHEPLLEMSEIKREDLGKFGNRLARSKLGSVEGYEFVPEVTDRVRENFWITCPTPDHCVRFNALSKTNPKALGVIGSLSKQN